MPVPSPAPMSTEPDFDTLVLPCPPPAFGHAMHEFFGFDPNYTNLNNGKLHSQMPARRVDCCQGSYGSLPLPVKASCDRLTAQIEANPDIFIRRHYQQLLNVVRERLATFIGAEVDECVLVPNTSHGLNTVLRNFEWNKGDVIIKSASKLSSAHAHLIACAQPPRLTTPSLVQFS